MALNRRQLINHGAAGAGLVVAGNLAAWFPATASASGARQPTAPARVAHARGGVRSWATGYGELVPDPEALLDLPEGFTYKIISEAGKPLTGVDGVLPDAFDGTALFEVDGRRFLVRNSEQGGSESDEPIEVPGSGRTRVHLRPGRARRDDDDGARRRQQRRRRVRQPGRHSDQLRRRRHAVGHVADVRGDRGRDRRRRDD